MMTAPDDLERAIEALKNLLSVAWSDLANPLLTTFERREARNQINLYGSELRRYLQAVKATLSRVRSDSLEDHSRHSSGKPTLRLLVAEL